MIGSSEHGFIGKIMKELRVRIQESSRLPTSVVRSLINRKMYECLGDLRDYIVNGPADAAGLIRRTYGWVLLLNIWCLNSVCIVRV